MVTPINVSLSYPGVLAYKEMIYTQTSGTAPDKVSLKIIPQASPVAAVGDLTFTYNGASLILNDCLIDNSNVRLTQQGWIGSFVLLDRRWRWEKAAHMSVHWNDRDANGIIAARSRRTVKEMLTEILAWLGETSIDVDAADATDYPEFNEISIHPVDLFNQVMDLYGYDVTLGFSGDPVTIVKRNEGAYPPIGGIRMVSSSFNPPTPVELVRTSFGPTKWQGRFKLGAIGLDTDGVWKAIDDLSYKPTGGWSKDQPGGFGKVLKDSGEAAHNLARETVYKFYRIASFSDGTFNIPDGSGTIQGVEQCLPLLEGLFPKTSRQGDSFRPKERLYGSVLRQVVEEAGVAPGNTDVDKLLEIDFKVWHKEGVVQFPAGEYMYRVVDGEVEPADLYLECVFQVRDNNDWQWITYSKDTTIDSNGFGVYTVSVPQLSEQVTVSYDASHTATGDTSTSSTLDAVAAAAATDHASGYSVESGQTLWYVGLQTSVRVDGAIKQVTHVISDTQGHYSIISRNISHDTLVNDASDKRAKVLERFSRESRRRYKLSQLRREAGRD